MSFNNDYLTRVSSTANQRAPVIWTYLSSDDAIATITASGYFNDAIIDLTNGVGKFAIGHVIFIEGSDSFEQVRVTAITTAVTVEHYTTISLDTENIVTTGNITGGNLIATSDVSGATLTISGASATGDLTVTGFVDANVDAATTGTYRYYASFADDVVFNDTASGKLLAAAAVKNYLLHVEGGRPVGQAMTGDSNDSAIKADYHNFAANDASSIIRGLNTSCRNRGAAATVNLLEGAQIGAQSKTSATAASIRGMSVIPENYATCGTEFGGIDVVLKNEANTATTSYGLRIRNIEASSQAAINQGIIFSNSSTNGFLYGIDMNGCDMATADIRLQNGTTIANTSAATLTITETNIDLVGALAADALTLSDVLTFSDGATIDNSDATTLTLTETNIDLVGALAADALTLSDVLTFSDGGTIDNSDATTLTITETNIDLVGALAADALTLSDVLTFSGGGTIDNTAADTLTITEDNIDITGATTITGVLDTTEYVTIVPTAAYVGDYRHYVSIDDGVVFNGTTTGKLIARDATKSYILNIEAGRPVGQGMTGDSNDAVIKADYHNFAGNDSNSIIRGINTSVRQRGADAVTNLLEGAMIGAQSKTSATANTIRGLQVVPESYSTNGTEFGGIDICLKDEVGAATLRYGMRIRNIDASAVTAMTHALLINSTATNGYHNAITLAGACDTFIDFDDVTGNACTETGSAATTWSGRIHVVTPDGNDGYINVYGTSNA